MKTFGYDFVNKKLILQKDQKQGFASLDGKIIIPIEYDNIIVAGSCLNCQKDGKVFLFNSDGNKILDKNFISILKTENEKYSICIDNNEKYGIIDENLNTIIENKYTFIQYLWDDFFIVKDDRYFGIISSSNEIFLDFKYDSLQKIEGIKIIEAIENNEVSYIDNQLKNVCKFKDVKRIKENDFLKLYSISEKKLIYLDYLGSIVDSKKIYTRNKLFAKEKNGKWSFVDKNDNFLVDAEYDYVTEFNSYGFAGILKDGKWGVISDSANVVLEPIYEFEGDNLPNFIGKYYETYLGYGERFYKLK